MTDTEILDAMERHAKDYNEQGFSGNIRTLKMLHFNWVTITEDPRTLRQAVEQWESMTDEEKAKAGGIVCASSR